MTITTCISAAVIEQLVCCQLDLLILFVGIFFLVDILRRRGSRRVFVDLDELYFILTVE